MEIYCTYFMPFLLVVCAAVFRFVNCLIHILECCVDTQQKKKRKKKYTKTHTTPTFFMIISVQEPRIIYLHEQLCFLSVYEISLALQRKHFARHYFANIFRVSCYFVNSPVKRDVQCGAALNGIKVYVGNGNCD